MYRHYKSDTNELFYIGIGKRRKGAFHSQIYARAYQCSSWSRNYLWLKCFNKHGRIVKILYDNLTEEECKSKEIELISTYGRIIDNSGCLCNISSNAHILDVLNNKRSNIKSWEVKYDL